MECIFILGKKRSFRCSASFLVVLCLIMTIAMFYIGNRTTLYYMEDIYNVLQQNTSDVWADKFAEKQDHIYGIKKNAEDNLNALSAQLSSLQARLVRLDVLGSRLVTIVNTPNIQFEALDPPGLGGPAIISPQKSLNVTDFIAELSLAHQTIEDRTEKFSAMESIWLDNDVFSKTIPQGSPLVDGWVSSAFGWRTDPISGKKEFHEGIDLVSHVDTKIKAVANGVVIWSARHAGYGNMVEIKHGNGYVTRYAHNKKNLVVIGELINKGDDIAIIGSSGRSTGNHVHFEITHNDTHVNPREFISVK